jgi:hypothetical protein
MRGELNRQGMRGGTRKKRWGGGPVGLLCSRNAHAQKVLVGRAQWETKQVTLPEEITSELGGEGRRSQVPFLLAERAR